MTCHVRSSRSRLFCHRNTTDRAWFSRERPNFLPTNVKSPPRGALFLREKNPEMVQSSIHEGGGEREVGPFIKHDSQAHCPTRSGLVPRSRGQKAPPRCDNVSLPLLHEQPNSSGEYHIRRLRKGSEYLFWRCLAPWRRLQRVRLCLLALSGALRLSSCGRHCTSLPTPCRSSRTALHCPAR